MENTTKYIVDNSMDIWEKYLETPFIKEMIQGILPEEKFKFYTIQDTLYIKDFSKVYAHAFINTEDIKLMRSLYENMRVVVSDESLLHIKYLTRYGIKEDDVMEMTPSPINKAYTSYMVETAKNGNVPEALAAVMPCILSYLYIANHVRESAKALGTLEGNHCEEWILEYSGERYTEACEKVTLFFNDLCKDLDADRVENLANIFRNSSSHELKFWDMSYNC